MPKPPTPKTSLVDEFTRYVNQNPSRTGAPCAVEVLPDEVRDLIENARGGTAMALAKFLQARGYLTERPVSGVQQTLRRHQKGECRCGPR